MKDREVVSVIVDPHTGNVVCERTKADDCLFEVQVRCGNEIRRHRFHSDNFLTEDHAIKEIGQWIVLDVMKMRGEEARGVTAADLAEIEGGE